MRENQVQHHRLAGVVIQRARDARRSLWAAEFQDAKEKGLAASFFKDYFIIGIDGLPHVVITNILNGREKVCPSIGAAMGFIQGKLFVAGQLI